VRLNARLERVEAALGAEVGRCKACGLLPGEGGPAGPIITVYGDPDSPENVELVERERLEGCVVCGWVPRITVLVVRMGRTQAMAQHEGYRRET
jgi:hypothetical protein